MAISETQLLQRALQHREVRPLLEYLTPIIHARVARELLKHGRGHHHSRIRQEIEDGTQDIWVVLFSENALLLRQWSPGRGLTLKNFVGLIAERRTRDRLKSRNRNPWTATPTEDLHLLLQDAGMVREVEARELAEKLVSEIKADQGPLGQQMFELLFIQDLPCSEIAAQTNKKISSVYKWRSRLRHIAREKYQQLMSERPPSPRMPEARTS